MKLALAGDTMLGRKVAERLAAGPSTALFSDGVVAAAREADLFVLNLECAISDRGRRWPDPRKPFFFRAPPAAVEVLQQLGVGCVTLANNHALDYGVDALLDTFRHLADAGISWVGAGTDQRAARAPTVLERDGRRVGVVGVTDHPRAFAATADRPGVAYADLRRGPPHWLLATIGSVDADVVLVSPHWGPNMAGEPVPYVRRAAAALVAAGATLVAGHSAHVFHGLAGRSLYDVGDFVDDYATDAVLRNDLGLLFLVTFDRATPVRVEAVPLALDYCHTRLADADEAAWIGRRFSAACAALGTDVSERDGRLVVELEREHEAEHRGAPADRVPRPYVDRGGSEEGPSGGGTAMEDRSRVATIVGAALGVAGVSAVRRARRRARLRGAAAEIVERLTRGVTDAPLSTSLTPASDEAHAPGHRHVPLAGDVRHEHAPPPVRERPFAKHRRGLRHPGKG